MSTQFTKEPWMAAAGPSSVVGWPIVSCGVAGGKSIANVPWMPGLPDELLAEIRANANLIAAAPSLYSDAEFLCARIRELEAELSGDDEASRQYFGHVLPAVARMESGLAEARGETSE